MQSKNQRMHHGRNSSKAKTAAPAMTAGLPRRLDEGEKIPVVTARAPRPQNYMRRGAFVRPGIFIRSLVGLFADERRNFRFILVKNEQVTSRVMASRLGGLDAKTEVRVALPHMRGNVQIAAG